MSKPIPNPIAGARFLLSCARLNQLPTDARPEVAFVGRSNAGKSSALNALCGQKALARVSKTPGRTQLINLFEAAQGRIADLPGYGYAKVPKDISRDWGKLIGAYLENRENLRGLVLIMDVRHPMTPFDQQMIDWAVSRQIACHILLTKADKLSYGASKNTLLSVQRAIGSSESLTAQLFSVPAGLGVDACRQRLGDWLGAGRDPAEFESSEGIDEHE
ncbi:YihA family ribosome biogenesis GTP-binding protein [Sinimarinibacterium sp. CAU 1509]|uniref:ribosome biogenesis GTP-binding protein YihA/YsxC n=1 Tax=Sinimarinibacterium sp. CAU 1509 TaxID=2562283 RepID=UPI0010AC0437|nr:ribosome biogenesis GTP-binding protein YihA/YsxC [Sinimarinibacterium sp. CAU 1509]TJY58784.1 YihA family ribosome biogenesis GTP-binding protein [Sinimarinibacterium sp. CAU 1509]